MQHKPDSWDRIQTLFDEALEKAPEDRAAFLHLACGDDPQLLAEVDSLLSSYPSAEEELGASPIQGIANADSASPPIPDDAIPGFRILKELHRGGQGVVYQAIQHSTKRKVALKVMLAGPFAGPASKRRFEREVELVGSMRHPGIVPIFDSGIAHGQYFYAMEYVQGEHLDTYVRNEHLPTRRILELFVNVCDAIDYAHNRGVIHRDIKPSNVLVGDSGRVHVLDFGLAKIGGADLQETYQISVTGQVMGTLAYMSPEQATGRPDQIDTRSDVYALGVVLYELLTGTLPYDLDSTMTDNLNTIQHAEPRRLTLRDRTINSEVGTIVSKALSKDKQRRYSTAGLLGDDINRFLRDEPIEAKRDSAFYVLRKTVQRHRKLFATGIAFVLLLTLASIVSTSMYWSANRAWRKEQMSSQQYRKERDKASELEAESVVQQRILRRNLYFSQMNQGGQATAERFGSDTIKSLLTPWYPKSGAETDLRGWEWYFLFGLTHRESFLSEIQGGWVWEADFNPDASKFAVAVNGRELQVRDSFSGKVVCRKRAGSFRCVDWSPDGKYIATGNMSGKLILWDAEQLTEIWHHEAGTGVVVHCVQFSPDSTMLATARNALGDGQTIRIWDTTDGSLIHTLDGHTKNVTSLRFSPDGSRLASAGRDRTTRIWDVKSGEQLSVLNVPSRVVAWNFDGSRLATGSPVRVWDAHTGQEIRSKPEFDANSLAWHPTFDRLACGRTDGLVTVWDTGGDSYRDYYGHGATVWSVGWSPDGRRLLSCGNKDLTARIWDVESGDRSQLLKQKVDSNLDENGVLSVEWSPDGERIAAIAMYGQTIDVWDTRTHRQIHSHRAPGRLDRVSWGPSGARLAFTTSDGATILNLETGETELLEGTPKGSAPFIAWHRNGRIAAGFRNPINELVVWNADGKRLATFKSPHGLTTRCLSWNSAGTHLATIGAGDSFVRVWDVESQSLVWEQETTEPNIRKLTWSPDDSTIISSHTGTLIVHESATGRELHRLNRVRERFNSVDWNPTSNRIAVGSGASVSVWEPDSGAITIKFKHSVTGGVRWSPDGKCLAAGCRDGIRIWDASRGYELAEEYKGSPKKTSKEQGRVQGATQESPATVP